MRKPPDCTCGYPDQLARNCCGHALSCPAYARWHRENIGEFKGPPEPGPTAADKATLPPPIEDRGTAAWIWQGKGGVSFAPFAGCQFIHEVSVPIGWSMVPHPTHGVILRNAFGCIETADQVFRGAKQNLGGFMIRSSTLIPF
jgi:hypothetical protein